ncbi:hypothetical protein ACWGCW_26385 [Streptomyces sp. NPDC054933]
MREPHNTARDDVIDVRRLPCRDNSEGRLFEMGQYEADQGPHTVYAKRDHSKPWNTMRLVVLDSSGCGRPTPKTRSPVVLTHRGTASPLQLYTPATVVLELDGSGRLDRQVTWWS